MTDKAVSETGGGGSVSLLPMDFMAATTSDSVTEGERWHRALLGGAGFLSADQYSSFVMPSTPRRRSLSRLPTTSDVPQLDAYERLPPGFARMPMDCGSRGLESE
ncbi:MAG: hypothetical protein WBQ30_15750, partial [Thermoanaerobaculia bacterium]